MNHLEPLFWSGPLQGNELLQHQHELMAYRHSRAKLSLSIRSSFRVIATFLEGCRQSMPPSYLAGSVHAARELGLITLELAIDGCLLDGSLREDCVRCLDGLKQLAHSLLEAQNMPQRELAHSLDNLIALLIQLEGVALAHPAISSAPPLNGLGSDSRKRRPSRRRHGPRAVAASTLVRGL